LGSGTIIKFIVGVFHLKNADIVTTSPFQFLNLAMNIGVYTGFILSLPFLFYHIYAFLKDGLRKKEKKLFFILLPAGFLLFLIGFFYSYTILYFYLNSVASLNVGLGIKNIWDVSSFLFQIILASVFLGVIFQFPIILTFLIRMGVVSVDFLRKKRRFAIAGMFIFVGFLPPPDILSTIFQATPLIVLYELTILVNARFSAVPKYLVREVESANLLTPIS
jgi:sec-independent protein translocase protein TatC